MNGLVPKSQKILIANKKQHNIASFSDKVENITPEIIKNYKTLPILTQKHDQKYLPSNKYAPPIWFSVTLCTSYEICKREKC